MTSKKTDIGGSKDFINNLPEALISHILSFIPIKEAALTSVLSKRWRYLFAFVPNLAFDDSVNDYYGTDQLKRREMRTNFRVFVDRVLALQGNALVNKFYLRCRNGPEPSSVNRWILNVLERAVVDLDIPVLYVDYGSPLPSRVFMSKTLVKLNVEGTCDFNTDVGEVFLPRLKTLVLNSVRFKENGPAFAKLISGCPALEVLVITNVRFTSWEYFVVSNPSLNRLEVCYDYSDGKPKSVSFDTPNVVYVKYLGCVAVKYPKVNFESLVEMRLDLRMRFDWNDPAGDSVNATDLIMGVCNVKTLYLSGTTLEVLASCIKAIPIFTNLIHLTINTCYHGGLRWEKSRWEESRWETLQKLLKNCPNLETLVVEGLLDKVANHSKTWEVTRTCLSSSPVKTLKVKRFGKISRCKGDDVMAKHKEGIKYFLETMPNLEQVMIYYDTSVDDDPSILSSELELLENVASSSCKIQVISGDMSLSCTVHSSSSTSGLLV